MPVLCFVSASLYLLFAVFLRGVSPLTMGFLTLLIVIVIIDALLSTLTKNLTERRRLLAPLESDVVRLAATLTQLSYFPQSRAWLQARANAGMRLRVLDAELLTRLVAAEQEQRPEAVSLMLANIKTGLTG